MTREEIVRFEQLLETAMDNWLMHAANNENKKACEREEAEAGEFRLLSEKMVAQVRGANGTA